MLNRISVIICFLMITSTAYSQEAYSFFGRIPPLPSDACTMTGEQMKQFRKQVYDLRDDLQKEILKKKKKIKEDVKEAQPQIEKKVAEEYGLSNTDVQKLKQKKLSQAEKKAIADKALKEKIGISMDEVEKLKKMSKEGKKAWAEGYSTQQMANLTGNADSSKSEEQIKREKKMEKDKKFLELADEQKKISDRINASDRKFANKMAELYKKDSIATNELKQQREPLLDKINSSQGMSEEERKELIEEVKRVEDAYCGKMTPLYISILSDCFIDLNKLMPDYKRLEEVTGEINKATTGADKDFTSPGLFQLEAVQSYTSLLLNVFKFTGHTFAENNLYNNENTSGEDDQNQQDEQE